MRFVVRGDQPVGYWDGEEYLSRRNPEDRD